MKTKPKIIAFMNSYSQGKSGGDMVFIETAKRMKIKNLTIVTSSLGRKLCKNSGLRKAYFLITTNETEFKNIFWIYFLRIIKGLLLQIKMDSENILLGASDFLPDILPIVLLKLENKKCKWVQHVFHITSSSRKIPYISQKISLFFIKLFADIIIVDNNLLRHELITTGFNSHKVKVNYPGINHQYLQSLGKKLPKKSYEAVYMAQLRPVKGLFDLINIWEEVCKKIPQAKLAIIGKGNDDVMKQLQNKIREYNLQKNVQKLGYLGDEKAFAIMKESKIFVFPSHEEGFGIAALESQMLGLPVVAWNLPVFEEIFPNGMSKIEIGKTHKFAKEVIKLLEDKQYYKHNSYNALENAKRFDWNKTAIREAIIINS